MPLPPLTTDYEVIGGNATYSTWGKLRTPIGKDNPYSGGTTKTSGAFSADYDFGFTAADGSLFRASPFFTVDNPPPRFVYVDYFVDGLFYMWASAVYDGNLLTQDDLDQLDGETVTMSGGSFTLDSDAWTNPPAGQTVGGLLGTITSIGKLAAF